MSAIIDYLLVQNNVEITTCSNVFDRFGSSVLANKIKLLEEAAQ